MKIFLIMENKETEINELLVRLSKELPHDYEIADFWDGDLTAVGIRVGNHLIYISTFDYNKTHRYNIIIEDYNTGAVIEEEQECTYDELKEIIKKVKE